MEIEKVYEPQRFEPRWAQWWIDRGFYTANAKSSGRMFSLVIPPPNVTGILHMGHMLEHTEIDVTVRWHRMRGDNTLWLPGTDHAGIATQMVVERKLAEEGLDRRTMGREAFEKRIWAWKEESGDTIKRQMIRLGTSCDWSRERFTLDEGLSRAVREVFVRLYEKDLIYRGEYMVNWCPGCQTAISDLEVVHEETNGNLWHIAYPVNGTDERLIVATTRPETMLGDSAVAINANDTRYLALHGKTVRLPLMDRDIPIILDDMADPLFGSGAVKVTPAHDPNDFEAGKRHSLPIIQVIDGDAKMTAAAGAYAGLNRFEARKRIVKALEEQGYLVKIEPHRLSIGKCQRSKDAVEPLVSKQWFVKTKPLAEPAIRVVEDGRIQFVPENWSKTYFEWMYNIRDWCISRQLWWGHRIPAWHCGNCAKVTVSRVDPSACQHCGSAQLTQDPDVLDTWFSSGLWPFSTLGWPDKTEDLATYYPTSLLITGFDILFFWVARMVMLGIECMGEVPFRQVYIHGLVRDADKQKMSKTKGNVIDPLVVTEKYGTDAVRLSLLLGAAPGTDIVLTEERMESARAFANKVWNASRLIFLNMERSGVSPWLTGELNCCVPEADPQSLVAPLEDRWIFNRLNRCADQVNRAIEQHRYHEAAQTLWHFVWGEFCDWYLEIKKLRLEENSGMNFHWRNLLTVYEMMLRLLHPVMPFLTEELWQRLATDGGGRTESISLSNFPQYSEGAVDLAAEQEMLGLQQIVTAAREIKADTQVTKKVIVPATLELEGSLHSLNVFRSTIEKMAGLTFGDSQDFGILRNGPGWGLKLHINMETGPAVPGTGDDTRSARLAKENERLVGAIEAATARLADDKFTGRAPAHIIDGLRKQLADNEAQLQKNQEALGA